ncbi:MAG TPA: lysophospholipid acyltransferase family protein [Rectinemataceae bacterium]
MAYKRGAPLINRSPLFLAASGILNLAVIVLGWPVAKILYGFSLRGRENLAALKSRPAVIVSNHSIPLDSLIHGLCILPRLAYFSVIEETIMSPFLGTLVRLLGGFPVSPRLARSGALDEAMTLGLKSRGTVFFYAEGECFLHNQEIKPLKTGAFYCAIRNQAPILPIVTVLKRRGGKALVRAEVHILPALQPPPASGDQAKDLSAAASIAQKARALMQEKIDSEGGDKSLYRGPMPRIRGINDTIRD